MNPHSNSDDEVLGSEGEAVLTKIHLVRARAQRRAADGREWDGPVPARRGLRASGGRSRNAVASRRELEAIFFDEGSGEWIEASQPSGPTNLPFAFLSVALLIYAMPKSLELLAAQYFNPWIAIVLPGDLTGCLWLAAIAKMRRGALLLYLVLTASEGCLYAFDLIQAENLVWLADLVPSLFVAGMLTRLQKGDS